MEPVRIQRVDTSVFVSTGLLERIAKRTKMTAQGVLALMGVPAMIRLVDMSASVLLERQVFCATWRMSV